MSKIEIDTSKIKINCENIESIATEFSNLFDDIFKTLNTLDKSGAWIGTNYNSSVIKYEEKVLKDRYIYNNFAKSVKSIGSKMKECADEFEKVGNEW